MSPEGVNRWFLYLHIGLNNGEFNAYIAIVSPRHAGHAGEGPGMRSMLSGTGEIRITNIKLATENTVLPSSDDIFGIKVRGHQSLNVKKSPRTPTSRFCGPYIKKNATLMIADHAIRKKMAAKAALKKSD